MDGPEFDFGDEQVVKSRRERMAATRAEALEQWRLFLPKIGRYAAVRNQVMVGHGNVSQLSPAVRCRLITEDELVADSLGRYRFASVEKWLQEVCWRRYWKGWLELRPGAWHDWRGRVEGWMEKEDAVSRRAEKVMAGRSGVAVMDGFARELVETGYLHNHARMWWASFWVHVERLPWELGAAFFFRHLLDADAASNTLSWRWVAGLQTPGKTYLVRRSNLEKCMDEIPDATGLERLEDGRIEAWQGHETADLTVMPVESGQGHEQVKGRRVGLWLHEEDLSVEFSAELAELKPVAVAAWWAELGGELLGASDLRRAHRARAMADAASRAAAHYGVEVAEGEVDDLAVGLVEWVRREKVEVLVAMRPCVGLLGDTVGRIEQAMKELGVEVLWQRRASDERLWPLAKRGFFPFWEKLSKDLRGARE